MESVIKEIKNIANNKKLRFIENFYVSKDEKTIMGELAFKEILFLDYRDSEAGSNPREYYGLKKTNSIILKSLLEHPEMFKFLHSGVIVSLTDPIIAEDKLSISYDDSCLTNGNQTRFIILIVTLLKLISFEKELGKINEKYYRDFIRRNFEGNERILYFLNNIKFTKFAQFVNFLTSNKKYLERFNEMNINHFLNMGIRIQINLLDPISEDLRNKVDSYSIGSLIAEANNATQNVKVDDIFGNKYKKELEIYIFNGFLKEYEDISIEYRMGEIAGKKVHILTLLRPIVALGILTKEKDIYKYTNQRAPIYKLFEKLLRVKEKEKMKNTISAISKLIPSIYNVRINYVEPQLEIQKRNFIREYMAKAINGELEGAFINKQLSLAKGDEKKIKRIIERNVNYNIEHIFPVLVYRIRKLFKDSGDGNKAQLIISEKEASNILKGLIEVIYKRYIELKLEGLPTSLTSVVRDSEFYKKGEETYIAFKNTYNIQESDYIENNKTIID